MVLDTCSVWRDFILAHVSLMETELFKNKSLALNPLSGFGFLIVVFRHVFGYGKIQNLFIG